MRMFRSNEWNLNICVKMYNNLWIPFENGALSVLDWRDHIHYKKWININIKNK